MNEDESPEAAVEGIEECVCGCACACSCVDCCASAPVVEVVEKVVEVEKLVEVEKVVEKVVEVQVGMGLTRAEMKGLLSNLPTHSERDNVQSAKMKLEAALKQ